MSSESENRLFFSPILLSLTPQVLLSNSVQPQSFFLFFHSFLNFVYWIWLENLLTQLGPLLMWNQFQQQHTRVCCLASNSAGAHLWPLARLGKDSTKPAGVFFTTVHRRVTQERAESRIPQSQQTLDTITQPQIRRTQQYSVHFVWSRTAGGLHSENRVHCRGDASQSDNKTLVHLTTQCASRLKHVRTNELLLKNAQENINYRLFGLLLCVN